MFYPFKIIEIIRQPNENITIQFQDLSGEFPAYNAGQFLTLRFLFGDREVRRSYSFSSSPDVDEPLAITVKRVDNGEISRLLHHRTQVGDVLEVMKPEGIFSYIPDSTHSPKILFLFAAGVGITPLYSILKTALVREDNTKIVLVYSNSSPERTVFIEELKKWQNHYPERLNIVWLFSNTKNLLKARLNRTIIHDIVQQYSDENVERFAYTCGPLFYMDLCRFTLLGIGFTDQDIRRETFHFPEEEEDDDEKEEEIVDTTTYSVKLHIQKKSYDIEVPYHKTILQAGIDAKINLPYSCKSGMCSTCISQVTKGQVRMTYNEVLTDREIENGRCLICTAHPTEEGTEIEIF